MFVLLEGFAERYTELCAFHPPSHWEQPMHSGWVMYDAVGEYARMGVPNQHWVVSNINELYQVGLFFESGAALCCYCCSCVIHTLALCAFPKLQMMM